MKLKRYQPFLIYDFEAMIVSTDNHSQMEELRKNEDG